jgi:hypothetical protein
MILKLEVKGDKSKLLQIVKADFPTLNGNSTSYCMEGLHSMASIDN